jgi:hypothetical protein
MGSHEVLSPQVAKRLVSRRPGNFLTD